MRLLFAILAAVLLGTIGNMSRVARFGRGLIFSILFSFWCAGVGLFLYMVAASGGRRGDLVFLAAVWGGAFLLLAWLALKNFRQALRPPPKVVSKKDVLSSVALKVDEHAKVPDMEIANEKLAALVKKPRDATQS
jgi:hypothetical protein